MFNISGVTGSKASRVSVINVVFLNPVNCNVQSAAVIGKAFPSTVPSHHRMIPDDYDDKPKQSHRSRSPPRIPRDRSEHSEPRKSASEFIIIISVSKIMLNRILFNGFISLQ